MLSMCLLFALSLELDLSLKAEASIYRDDIYIKDVLTQDSYHQLRERGLANLKLGSGPGFNRNRSIHRTIVSAALHRAAPEVDVSFNGPMSTVVKRPGGHFSSEKLEQAVREWIDDQESEQGIIHLEDIRIPKVTRIPPGDMVYQIRARNDRLPIGRQALYVDLIVNDDKFKTLVVSVQTSLEAMVAVATSDMDRGQPYNEDRVSWEVRRLDRLTSLPLTPDQLAESRAKTIIRPGTILTSQNSEVMPLVERNQLVYVTAGGRGLSITLRAEAIDNGGKGELVRLKNTDTGQIMRGIVTAPGQVHLDL